MNLLISVLTEYHAHGFDLFADDGARNDRSLPECLDEGRPAKFLDHYLEPVHLAVKSGPVEMPDLQCLFFAQVLSAHPMAYDDLPAHTVHFER